MPLKAKTNSEQCTFGAMQKLRLLLYPFSVLYGCITAMRNVGFNKGLLSSETFKTPVIAFGNLNTGGTGKTPHSAFLLSQLQGLKTALVSRGYGRNTKGLFPVELNSSPENVGDEPLMLKINSPSTEVLVCEKRAIAIQHLEEHSQPDVIVLDDAFQHRYIKADKTILLTVFNDLFVDDHVLPAGNLREPKSGAKRADLIIVSKSPKNLSSEKKEDIKRKISSYSKAPVLFSSIAYAPLKYLSNELKNPFKDCIALTGIANALPFIQHLQTQYKVVKHYEYADHHNFSSDELEKITKQSKALNIPIITTEKDVIRIPQKLRDEIFNQCTVAYIPISIEMDQESLTLFNSQIIDYVRATHQNH